MHKLKNKEETHDQQQDEVNSCKDKKDTNALDKWKEDIYERPELRERVLVRDTWPGLLKGIDSLVIKGLYLSESEAERLIKLTRGPGTFFTFALFLPRPLLPLLLRTSLCLLCTCTEALLLTLFRHMDSTKEGKLAGCCSHA